MLDILKKHYLQILKLIGFDVTTFIKESITEVEQL
jgi:hypothetical protein